MGLLDGSLEKANDHMTLTGNHEATLKANASGNFTVEVAGFTIKQTDYTGWVGGQPDIAGIKVSSIPGAATCKVTFTFTVPSKGNTYLSGVTFDPAGSAS